MGSCSKLMVVITLKRIDLLHTDRKSETLEGDYFVEFDPFLLQFNGSSLRSPNHPARQLKCAHTTVKLYIVNGSEKVSR